MPFTPRGRDAATLLAVIATIVLAFAWLHSSEDATPQVPAGLSVATLPAVAPEEPAAPNAVAPPKKGIERERPGGDRAPTGRVKRRHTERAGGHEGARTRRGTAGEAGGQDPPATAPAPSVGSGPNGSGASGSAPPEFALE